MKIVEFTPRLDVSQVRRLPHWGIMASQERVPLVVDVACVGVAEVHLTWDEATFGRRWWLECPKCLKKRRHLYLVGRELVCRACGGLIYLEQSWPDSRWRVEVGRPLLQAFRRVAAATTVLGT